MTPFSERMHPTAARFLLQRCRDGGVMADFHTGNIYHLNLTAALVCEAALSSDRPEQSVSRTFAISESEAAQLVSEVMNGLTSAPVRTPPAGAYHFRPSTSGYVIEDGSDAVLGVDEKGQTVHVIPGAGNPSLLEFYVRALAPKLLFRQGVIVLHASSCLRPDRGLVAFAGLSGAGKTTTARAFDAAGFQLVSEDLLVVSRLGLPHAYLGAEKAVHTWATSIANQLRTRPDGVPVGDLTQILGGPVAAISEVLFVDKHRRRGVQFCSVPLTEAKALVALLPHQFLGSHEVEAWRRYLNAAAALAASVTMAELWCPEGVDNLPAAVVAYTEKQAS